MAEPILSDEHPPVVLSHEEWTELSNCASALFAALKFYEQEMDEAWELVIAVQQRLQRAMAPIDERVTEEFFKDSE